MKFLRVKNNKKRARDIVNSAICIGRLREISPLPEELGLKILDFHGVDFGPELWLRTEKELKAEKEKWLKN
jgi:hypothetical protein